MNRTSDQSSLRTHHRMSVGQTATLACLWECAAPKPGNVHRGADFPEMTFEDMMTGAVAIGPVMQSAGKLGLGQLIMKAVSATAAAVGKNTNLGTILLLAPLAKAAHMGGELREVVARLLAETTIDDARDTYEAIRLARPGGMGRVERADLSTAPDGNLREMMALAESHDLVAYQYAHDFVTIFDDVLTLLQRGQGERLRLAESIIHAQMHLMAKYPDSLIARKCGAREAHQSAAMAERVLQSGPVRSEPYLLQLAEFDFWLRSDGHRRNPGTTADLIAAGLFVALWSGTLDTTRYDVAR